MRWTIDQVKEHPLWRGLTAKERRFFELLELMKLDDRAAAAGAFALRPQSIQVRLNQIRANQDTGFLYRAMMGLALPTREELAAHLWQLAQSTKDEARSLTAAKSVAEILQYNVKARAKDPEASPDGAPEETREVPGKSGKVREMPTPDLSGFRE